MTIIILKKDRPYNIEFVCSVQDCNFFLLCCGYVQHSEGIVMVKIALKPTDTVLLQVYMPTTEYEDEAVEEVYEEIEELIKHVRGDENLIILGDWNAIVGEGTDGRITSNYGLGK
jgi:exonuclease III